MDDLVFPSCVDTIGSVVGGEWNPGAKPCSSRRPTRSSSGSWTAASWSTPALKAFIEQTYGIRCAIFGKQGQSATRRAEKTGDRAGGA